MASILGMIRWITGLSIAVLIAGFAAFNTDVVPVIWAPALVQELPLFVPVLIFLILGFVIGSVSVWLNSGNLRAEKRRLKKQLAELERKLNTIAPVQQNSAQNENPVPAPLSSLTKKD